jgi:hypothetical protein
MRSESTREAWQSQRRATIEQAQREEVLPGLRSNVTEVRYLPFDLNRPGAERLKRPKAEAVTNRNRDVTPRPRQQLTRPFVRATTKDGMVDITVSTLLGLRHMPASSRSSAGDGSPTIKEERDGRHAELGHRRNHRK